MQRPLPYFTRLLLLIGWAMSPLLAHAHWTEASSRHFLVIAEGKPEEVRGFAERLERFDQAVRKVGKLADFELAAVNRLTVYVGNDFAAVEGVIGPHFTGVYRARTTGAVAVVARDRKRSGTFPQTLLFHEYAHHLLLSSHPVVWPVWLKEGLAEFYATAVIDKEGSVYIGFPPVERAYSLLGSTAAATGSHLRSAAQQLPLEQLLAMNYGPRYEDTLQLYARGWLLVHHLMFASNRQGQLDQYLTALERGTNSVTAGAAAFGTLATLDRDLDAHLEHKPLNFLTVPAEALDVGPITLRTLSPGERAVLPYRIRGKLGVTDEQAQEVVSSVRKVAGRFPTDAIVQSCLAQAEFTARSYAAAEAAADRALAIEPDLVEAYLYKGLAKKVVAREAESRDPAVWSEVRNLYLAANRIEPDNPLPLILFYETFGAAGENAPANAIAGLHRARELVPQITGLQLMSGYEYLAAAQVEPARKALALFAFQPDSGELGSKVAGVLETLDREGAKAAQAAFVHAGLKVW